MRTGYFKTKTLAFLLMSSILLSACGEVREVPELKEPLTEQASFRPVMRADVGNLKVKIGNVTPRPYVHFFERQTVLKEITCDVGQYVEKGQVLAVADIERLGEELTEIKADLDLLVAEHTYNEAIYELNQKILASQRQECLYRYDEDTAANYTTEIKKGEENHTYDTDLYNYMVDYYGREIAEIQKTISEGTVRAKHTGYVTYVKDTSKGSTAGANEAIVIVSDYDDTYIEVPSVTADVNEFKKHEVKYALVNGEKIPIEEVEYTNQELVYANARKKYPAIRYRLTEQADLKLGDTVILCFMRNDNRNLLTVGYDSTNSDENGSYVYVKKPDGGMEKRYVEVGVTDDCTYEIKSGLQEGELVYYTQESVSPARYEKYTVEPMTFTQTVQAGNLKKAETINTAYFTPVKGKVISLPITPGKEVKKGEVLAVIDSGSGEAAIKEVENDIKHLQMDYEKYVQDTDKNIKTMTVQGLMLLTVIEEGKYHNTLGEHEEDAIECQRTVFDHRVSIAENEKQIRRLEYESNLARLNRRIQKLKKNNNGNGEISIVAEEDGIVSRVYVTEGELVEPGTEKYLLFSCTRDQEGMGSIALSKSLDIPPISCEVNITVHQKTDKYKGYGVSCVQSGKAYAFTEDDKTCLSVTNGNDIEGAKYVFFNLEDKEFFDKVQIKDCDVTVTQLNSPNMIVLPGSVVYKEENKITQKMRYYVWKIIDGDLVKQYVIPGVTFDIGTEANVVILRGVEPGDVLAKESQAGTAGEEQ